jgi:hypothetical protein
VLGFRQLASLVLAMPFAVGGPTSARMPPPRLKPASGWYVITTGPKSPPTAPSVLAATIPVRRDPGGAAALQHSTIDALPPGGIVVQAGNYGRQKMANSPVRRPPLTIRGAQIRRCFEGISCRHAYAVLPRARARVEHRGVGLVRRPAPHGEPSAPARTPRFGG